MAQKHKAIKTFDLDFELNLIRKKYIPENTNPDRFFNIGQRVKRGNIKEVYIISHFDNYKYYHIHEILQGERETNFQDYERGSVVGWIDLYPFRTSDEDKNIPILHENIDQRLNFQQRDISELLHTYYNSGIDMDPEYQREFVWSYKDKVKLIHSIFCNIDIGKFVICRRPWETENHLYEILDGKQRLRTILDFYEGKFTYRGFTFHELSRFDQVHFKAHPISLSIAENFDLKDKLCYFLKLNTGGVPQDPAHIKHVEEMYIEEMLKKGEVNK